MVTKITNKDDQSSKESSFSEGDDDDTSLDLERTGENSSMEQVVGISTKPGRMMNKMTATMTTATKYLRIRVFRSCAVV